MIKRIYRKYIYRPFKVIKAKLKKISVKIKIRKSSKKLRIIIGAGGTKYKEWISTDKEFLDITTKDDWDELLGKQRLSHVLAEHVFEHLTYGQAKKALSLINTYLLRGGTLRIAVPDAYHPSKYVYDLIKPNGLDIGSDDHKMMWNCTNLVKLANDVGFKTIKVEYFDKIGRFHYKKMDTTLGYISRSAFTYRGRFTESQSEYLRMIKTVPKKLRNQFIDNDFSYTSLLIDCIKL